MLLNIKFVSLGSIFSLVIGPYAFCVQPFGKVQGIDAGENMTSLCFHSTLKQQQML